MTSFEHTITSAWQKQSGWLWLLLPLMLLYWLGSSIHRALYQLGIKTPYHASVPVLVVGNITVGGSGKTPLLIAFVRYLQQKNMQVAVISRGYGTSATVSRLVGMDAKPSDVGDEPCLIKQATGVPVCVGRHRAESIQLIQTHYPQTQLILCDDGLQHHKLHHDMAWIVYDAKRGLGNNMLLPVGFLREWSHRLTANKPNETVLYHGDTSKTYHMQLEKKPLQTLFSKQQQSSPPASGSTVHGVTGIGYPVRFFNSLRELGYDVLEHPFPDHHAFTEQDVCFDDDLPIIVTSKDAVKIGCLDTLTLSNDIWVLPVEASLSLACYDTLDSQLEPFLTSPS